MSKRRNVGDIVVLQDNEDGPYLGRIDALGADRKDECPKCCDDPTHDPHCREWPNVEVMDAEGKPTGHYVYHVTECEMSDRN